MNRRDLITLFAAPALLAAKPPRPTFPADQPGRLSTADFTAAIPGAILSTAGATHHLFQLPAKTWLTDLWCVPGEIDIHASPCLTYELVAVDRNNVARAVLTQESLKAQAGNGDADRMRSPVPTGGGRWIAWRTVRPAATITSGAATVRVVAFWTTTDNRPENLRAVGIHPAMAKTGCPYCGGAFACPVHG